MNAKWVDGCLTTAEGRTLAVVRENQHGEFVWHARNSYTMSGEAWFGPERTADAAEQRCVDALREDYELYKKVFGGL